VQNLNYSYRELVHYLDMHTTDPLVRRLINFILDGEDLVMTGLIDAGMDPLTFEFTDSYEYYSPGDYIEKLRRDCDSMEQDLHIAQDEYETVVRERDRLSTRSVANLLMDMEELVKRSNAERDQANRVVRKVEQENDELKEKINVWKVIES